MVKDFFFPRGRKEEEGRGEEMRSCWGKSTGNGIGDPDEMPEQGQAAGDWAEERGTSEQLGWMGGGPSKMKNKWGRAQTLMLWPRGLFSGLCATSCLIQSRPSQWRVSFPQPEMP